MRGDLRILAFDTSGPWCAAALLIGERIVAARHEDMAKGQGERLMPMLDELLVEGNATWDGLDAIGVGVGPGNFTGVRIAVSAARGLALGLGIPAVGVNGFEAMRHLLAANCGRVLALIPAPRDQAYWEHSKDGVSKAIGLSPIEFFKGHTYPNEFKVIWPDDYIQQMGSCIYTVGDEDIELHAKERLVPDFSSLVAIAISEVAASVIETGPKVPRPSPLYIRPADAAPASDPPPVILP